MGPNTVEISTTAPLAYLLITLDAIQLEKVSHSDMQYLKSAFSHIDFR